MKTEQDGLPAITLRNRQRTVPVNAAALTEFGRHALTICAGIPNLQPIRSDEVAIIIISDRRMAGLHQRFMNISGPTDVITFQHGEVFISAETARRNARRFRTSLTHELQLYIVHGLLHLRGCNDQKPAEARRMEALQNRIMRETKSRGMSGRSV